VPRIDGYKNALDIARSEFRKKDPITLARNSGAIYQAESKGTVLHLPFFYRKIRITWPEGEVIAPEGAEDLSFQEKGLIMHYMIQATGAPLTHTWITFREIPSGEFYYPAFVKRAKEPLVRTFGSQPELLIELGKKMGGTKGVEGNASVCLQVFPQVPVCLMLWAGDDEFPPDGNLLFDASISKYLSAEDIAVLSGLIVYPLIGMADKKN
jgi:hypothetical protein